MLPSAISPALLFRKRSGPFFCCCLFLPYVRFYLAAAPQTGSLAAVQSLPPAQQPATVDCRVKVERFLRERFRWNTSEVRRVSTERAARAQSRAAKTAAHCNTSSRPPANLSTRILPLIAFLIAPAFAKRLCAICFAALTGMQENTDKR